jgi:hypothetical protein
MKLFPSLFLILLTGFYFLTDKAEATPSSDKTIIAGLEEQWIKAFKKNDPTLLDPILAKSWIQTDSEGVLTGKPHEMADTKQIKWSSLKNIDIKTRIYRDTAIVTGIFKGKGTASWGIEDDNYRFTDTWVKMPKGNWQCVATQLTTLSK